MPGRSRSTTEERALESSGAGHSLVESRGGSLDGHYVAPARSVTAKVPGMYYSTEAGECTNRPFCFQLKHKADFWDHMTLIPTFSFQGGAEF